MTANELLDAGAADTRSIVLAGVGGQGTVLAASLLARALTAGGFEVKTSEVHGMAQRGGSVISMVRFGTRVFSPLVSPGEAEAVVATELLEALRNLQFLSPSGLLIASRARVDPLTVLQGAAEYPAGAEEWLARLAPRCVMVDAAELAADAGDVRAANTVLLGVLSLSLPVSSGTWMDVIDDVVPGRARRANREAFSAGRELQGTSGEEQSG